MFDKKIGNCLDEQLRNTSKEKVNLTLESLRELNEEEHNEEVIKDSIIIGPTKYSIEVYKDNDSGYIARWEDDTDNGFGYNNKGFVNLDEKAKFFAFKEKGYVEPEDFISVISVYDRPLKTNIKEQIIRKVLEIKGLNDSEEKLEESLDENTKKEVEVELEDILKRNPEKHGFDADTEEVKYYVVKLLKDKGYKTETSGNNNYKPNKYHVEYWKEEQIEESVENKKWYVYMDSPYASAEKIGSADTKEEAEAIKAKKDAEWKPGYLWNTYISDKEIKETNLGWD